MCVCAHLYTFLWCSFVVSCAYSGGDQPPKWYKFDDGEVSECKMEDDEEMKNQCFGGEYLGEVFDHMLKRSEKDAVFFYFLRHLVVCLP